MSSEESIIWQFHLDKLTYSPRKFQSQIELEFGH